jgi:ATP-dependent RNA helicase HelY
VIELLDDRELLPAIVFIFSRAACDDAVRQCLRDGLRLTDRSARATIRAIAEAHVAALSDDDLDVLGYGEWLEGLESGIAAHHAGLVPAFREAVEACFAAGLLKAVFATETLSLGINMPARSVVIERFTKFGGAGRAPLTSGEYAQLTGRAGRRGLDREGHAVVLWSAETAFADVARVATAPSPDLRSAFRPTYNMAVNLVRRFDRPTALDVLRRSFAQWQADAAARTRKDSRSGGDGVTRLNLGELLGRRLAVLEERAYVDGWRLTDRGARLAGVYHECDLLVAEVVDEGVLDGAEPSVIAGVLCALVFEARRAQRAPSHGRGEHGRGASRRTAKGRPAGDRLGEGRRSDLAARVARVAGLAERLRTLEEVHLVPRTRAPDPGASRAVAAWARGAPFGLALELAAMDVGVLAPGDFVRTVKQVADLAEQVSVAAGRDGGVGAAAAEAARLLVRDVVATGGATASNIAAATRT